MANALNTNSTLDFASNGHNSTRTAIATNIIILVGMQPVGAIKSLQITETRAVHMINEIGTDGSIDSVPTSSVVITGSCNRVRFDRMRIAEAFGRSFIHVGSQAYPFDIMILDKQKKDESNQITTIIKNVWITQIQYQLEAENWIISEAMTFSAENIHSYKSTDPSQPAATGGDGKIKLNLLGGAPSIEQLADIGAGGRRGALDASGLIDIGSADSIF
jgi:hypothetical protein